ALKSFDCGNAVQDIVLKGGRRVFGVQRPAGQVPHRIKSVAVLLDITIFTALSNLVCFFYGPSGRCLSGPRINADSEASTTSPTQKPRLNAYDFGWVSM
ncbi:hypothetical protein CWB99_23840, partial [Pseudoalteromonas rubra]